ncbi:TPA: VWA domain-containing protein [Haemophilus influenzae]|uniref:vWA domain-containing protein n=1 Tax=Haemophilus influenzae TaxID=727 RepID=UPI000E57E693|nr:VWA domain-containing protein [Haemophilus influenzae]
MSDFSLIDNPSARCACVLVLDTSGSMSGDPINQLNSGVHEFISSVQKDDLAKYSVELAVLTAGMTIDEVLPFTTAKDIDYNSHLEASGMTPLGGAVEQALRMLEERKEEYKQVGIPYYQPWLVIISDGAPTDNWAHIAQKAKDLCNERKLVSLAVGVNNADMSILSEFSNRPALKLQGLNFKDFFEWLSASMSRVSGSGSTAATVNLPSVSSWASI